MRAKPKDEKTVGRRDFLRAIIDGREPAVTGADGRKVVELISAIYQSSNEGRAIRLT